MREKGIASGEDASEQEIICYIPEHNRFAEYPLYAGLPTKHMIKIPLAIDAPFELTTSREEIRFDCNNWNKIVRDKLYQYLQDEKRKDFCFCVQRLAIIPVYGTVPDTIEYLSWSPDTIYVKPGVQCSLANYFILDEEILPKADCERMLRVNINEMNERYQRSQYNEALKQKIKGKNIAELYPYLHGRIRDSYLEKMRKKMAWTTPVPAVGAGICTSFGKGR